MPLLLSVTALAVIVLYIVWNINAVVFPYRFSKLCTLLLMAYTVSVSTFLFQIVSNNRLLTPSILGFDQLYILIQAMILYSFSSFSLPWMGDEAKFVIEATLLVGFSVSLFRWLFGGTIKGLHLTLLVGVAFGGLFFSLRMFLQLQLNPDQVITLTDAMFANFNKYNKDLLGFSIFVTLVVSYFGWRMRTVFDVLALGRELAVSLGVDYQREVTKILTLVAVLVAVSTALVGPISFFGLLVVSLAYQVTPKSQYIFLIPLSILWAIVFLVGGQFILEQVFNLTTRLSFIIEFLGGLVFLILVMRGRLL
ncbi:iron chelate uptake ABC transporter family permease subunit [Bartonella sp. DGB2]|uniref:iron chelate uptake ABC transporter family permease subunit n=1 Tax=Bartonella sp. DGB2 TaxID=3388426 RepID=UPI00398FDD71